MTRRRAGIRKKRMVRRKRKKRRRKKKMNPRIPNLLSSKVHPPDTPVSFFLCVVRFRG